MSRADRVGTQRWLLRASTALALLMLGANLLAWLRPDAEEVLALRDVG